MKVLLMFLLTIFFVGKAFSQTAIRVPIGNNINKSNELPVSKIAENIEFVPLETNENCLLSEDLSKIEIFENTIFLSDYKYIFRFDMNGKFLNRIGRIGKGPGEYTQGMQTFLIDKQNRHLIFFEMVTKKMMTFDFEGKFIRERILDFLPGPAEWVNNENMAVYNMGFTYENTPWKDFYILNRDGDIIQKNKFKKQANKRYGMMIYPQIFYQYNGKTRYKNPYENIIYEINEDKKASPVYFLDYGKYEKYNDIDDAEVKIRNGVGTNIPTPKSSEKIGLLGLSETTDYLFIYYGHQEERRFGVFDKKAKTFFKIFDNTLEIFGFSDNMHGGLPVLPTNGIINKTLYTCYDAWELKEYLNKTPKIKLKKIIDSINQNDNPVLLLVKLKE